MFDRYKPEVAFGWHAWASLNTGTIGYRSGPFMAGSQAWNAVVTGRQTHGSRPWQGVDPIVVAAQIVNGLQTVVSRQVDITRNPAVVSVGVIKGGVRNNIIPGQRGDDRHHPHLRGRAVRAGHAGDEAHGGEHRGGERRHRHVHAGSVQQPGHLQQPGAHGARVAQPAQGRGRRPT